VKKAIAFCAMCFIVVNTAFSFMPDSVDKIELLLGELHTIKVDNPIRVAIDNPDIADIDRVVGNEVFVLGKSAGQTTLRVWDSLGDGREINIKVFTENLQPLRNRIEKTLVDVGINNLSLDINKNEQKIFIYGVINPSDKDILDKAIEPFIDSVVNLTTEYQEKGLVQIDVQILELTKDAQKQLGFNWVDALQFIEQPYQSDGGSTGTTLNYINKATSTTLFNVNQWSRDALTTSLSLLESEGKLKVLSRPKLVCLSGKEAKFLVGGEIPVVTQSTSDTGTDTSVEYKEIGVSLRIQPTITEDNRIDTLIKVEVTDVVLNTALGAAQYNSTLIIPAFDKRNAETHLYLEDEQTVFIAGLIKDKTDEDIERVPWLGNIPILGAFFRSKTTVNNDTELVISLSPKIVSKKSKARQSLLSRVQTVDLTAYDDVPVDLKGYSYSLKRRIYRAATYPDLANQAGYQGMVKLSLHILASGEIKDIIVAESSGYRILDNAAVDAVKSLDWVSPFPTNVSIGDIWLDVPIVYKID